MKGLKYLGLGCLVALLLFIGYLILGFNGFLDYQRVIDKGSYAGFVIGMDKYQAWDVLQHQFHKKEDSQKNGTSYSFLTFGDKIDAIEGFDFVDGASDFSSDDEMKGQAVKSKYWEIYFGNCAAFVLKFKNDNLYQVVKRSLFYCE